MNRKADDGLTRMVRALLPEVILGADEVADIEIPFFYRMAAHAFFYRVSLHLLHQILICCQLKEVSIRLLPSSKTHLWLQLKPAAQIAASSLVSILCRFDYATHSVKAHHADCDDKREACLNAER